LPYRRPLDADSLLGFFAERAVPRIEEFSTGTYRRTMRLPRGAAVAEYSIAEGHIDVLLSLSDLRDLTVAIGRSRRMLDLDADPVAIDETLARDRLLRPLVLAARGRRVPGGIDPHEVAMRAVLGQQVSVAGARTLAGRLAERCGETLVLEDNSLTRLFPSVDAVAVADLSDMGMPQARVNTLQAVAGALAGGAVDLDPGADRESALLALGKIKGVGPWTAAYVQMRALKDPDAWPWGDLGVAHALRRLAGVTKRTEVVAVAEKWRPWRAYAVQHLWASLGAAPAPPTVKTTLGKDQ
jgi:AraC family transcriptional regulator of adaptative response / DNA-3-methyladenine glycosylase II